MANVCLVPLPGSKLTLTGFAARTVMGKRGVRHRPLGNAPIRERLV
jgi:hypothetical protein